MYRRPAAGRRCLVCPGLRDARSRGQSLAQAVNVADAAFESVGMGEAVNVRVL